jgi:hypothetical protein
VESKYRNASGYRVRKGNPMCRIDTALVARLIATQFPDWSDLASYRLRRAAVTTGCFTSATGWWSGCPARQLMRRRSKKEQRWLPNLAPGLAISSSARGDLNAVFRVPFSTIFHCIALEKR